MIKENEEERKSIKYLQKENKTWDAWEKLSCGRLAGMRDSPSELRCRPERTLR